VQFCQTWQQWVGVSGCDISRLSESVGRRQERIVASPSGLGAWRSRFHLVLSLTEGFCDVIRAWCGIVLHQTGVNSLPSNSSYRFIDSEQLYSTILATPHTRTVRLRVNMIFCMFFQVSVQTVVLLYTWVRTVQLFGAEVSGRFVTNFVVPKCLGAKVSCGRIVRLPSANRSVGLAW